MKYALSLLAGFIFWGTTASVAADFALSPAHNEYAPAPGGTADAAIGSKENIIPGGKAGAALAFSWHELEHSKGNYNLDPLLRGLRENTGKTVFFNFVPVNAVKKSLPADIARLPWSDPALIDRFLTLLNKIAANQLHAPVYVAVGQDADIYFQAHPAELVPFLSFYRYAQLYLHSKFPGVKAGVAMSAAGLTEGRKDIILRLLDVSDIAVFSDYPVTEMKALPAEKISQGLDALIEVAGKKPVVLEQAGFPPNQVVLPPADEQTAFLKAIAEAVKRHPAVVFANLVLPQAAQN